MTKTITPADPRIADKLARLADIDMPADKLALVISGTGGSPKRARKAIRYGLADLFAEAYVAALTELGTHELAVLQCDELFDMTIAQPRSEARAAVRA